jgi:hypothetical protein
MTSNKFLKNIRREIYPNITPLEYPKLTDIEIFDCVNLIQYKIEYYNNEINRLKQLQKEIQIMCKDK